MEKPPPSQKTVLFLLVFFLAYVAWVAYYLIALKSHVMMWCYKNLGMTWFPGLFHLFMIFSPFFIGLFVLTIVVNILGTILGRKYD